MSTIKYRLERAEKFSGKQPFARLTDEQLDARIKEFSIKGGLPPLDEAIKIYGSLPAYIKWLRESIANDSQKCEGASAPGGGGNGGSIVHARTTS